MQQVYIRIKLLWISIAFSILLIACSVNNKTTEEHISELPPSIDSTCFYRKKYAYEFVQKQDLFLIVDISYDSGGNLDKRIIFDSLCEAKFGLSRSFIFDSYDLNCTKPIMDSAITSIYGKNALDSIPKLLYEETERIYTLQNKK